MSSRARSALMTNLAKKGWTVDKSGGTGTYQNLALEFGEDVWKMSKDGSEVAAGDYGKTQMADVKAAAASAGNPFDSSSSKKASPSGGGQSAKARQAAARAKQAASKEAGSKDNSVE